jgi:hypothetical protein
VTPDAEITIARMEEIDASFRIERLTTALDRLKQGHEQAVAREKELARKAEIAEAEEGARPARPGVEGALPGPGPRARRPPGEDQGQ